MAHVYFGSRNITLYKTVVDSMNDNDVNFEKKDDEPANLPELHPIEHFWGKFKRKNVLS